MNKSGIERLLDASKINSNGCIEWIKSTDKDGYGKIYWNQKNWRAHRLSIHLFRGGEIDGKLVCHHCDNPKCVNPHHLFIGDPLTNMQDKVSKGRLKNQFMNRSHCVKGHEYTTENTILRKNQNKTGGITRNCKICYVDRYTKRNQKSR